MSEDPQNENEASRNTSRPTSKRQLSGITDASQATKGSSVVSGSRTNSRSDEPKYGGSIKTFFPEVVSEMRKVIWPTSKQMVIYTAVVLVFLILVTALVSGVDFLAGLGVEKVLTK